MTQLDCTIIGGGIAGLTTALALQDSGWNVTVLERQAKSAEASWAGGGILCPLYAWRYPEPVRALAHRGMALYPALATALSEQAPIDPEYQRSGMLILDPLADGTSRGTIDQWAAESGTAVEWVPANQQFPGLSDDREALWMPDIANVRNPRLLKALRAAAMARGIRIEDNTEVLGIEMASGSVTGVRLANGIRPATHVVVAAGAWSSTLIPEFSPAGVFPVRGQMLRLAGRAPHGVPTILMDEGVYLIPRLDGGVIVGSTVEHVGFDKHPTEEVIHRLHRKAIALWPDLDHAPITHQWAGLRPGTQDELPIIGPHPDVQGLYVNTGHYRNGLAMAPAIAEMLDDLMNDRQPLLDPTPYDPARLIRHP